MKRTQKIWASFFLAAFNSLMVLGQQHDQITTEVSYTLQGDSDVDLINYRINAKVYEKGLNAYKGFFSARLIAEHTSLNYNASVPQSHDLDQFYSFGVELSYLRLLNKTWSTIVILRPQLSSNFASDLRFDDFNPNATILFNYSKKPTYRLSFGASYLANSPLGFPLLPYINYWKKLSATSEMNLGLYESSYSYKVSEATTLTAFFGFEGFNYNISEHFTVGDKTAESINYVEVKTGLRLQQRLTKLIRFNLDAGYALSRNLDFMDDSQNEVTEFDMKNNVSLSAGIFLNFSNKKKQQPQEQKENQ
ncbi:DUF6268 family outer membrane beta-barrel protein [Winogradskyella sp.]|jgi:hypothetical protein|uniref:DUF6268 family outer membrane beta-barrel protein n=1 Tax=Winogradskyella sp. TaxID=1883156 RepID=UPI0025EB4827|nr:DUF6268 family outer membrane beta-barrel protein [Winogradskyella sp.]MCT4629046.1 DUF6268 family outer membrane beta-barrel protein [Winogradskyella sp.]